MQKKSFRLASVLGALALLSATPLLADPAATTGALPALEGADDFNFLHGKWRVKNRRLVKWMQGSDEWVAFEARTETRPLPGGLGNQEIYRSEIKPGFVGIGLRVFNPDTRQWSLYWVDNRNAPGVLQPPVTGAFEHGVGIFEGADQFQGKPILARFTWKPQDRNNARWEQAFSADGGKTWETNWTMDFTRLAD